MEGLLPLLHLGSVIKLELTQWSPFAAPSTIRSTRRTGSRCPARYRAALAEGVVLAMPVDLKPCVGVWRPEEYERYTARALAELPPLSPRLTELERFFYGSSHDAELDAAGRIMVPGFLGEHAGAGQGGRGGRAWATAWSCGPRAPGANIDRRC